VVIISNILLVAFSLSMDAFALSMSYGVLKASKKQALITAFNVGIFHFLMPYFGNKFGNFLFEYVAIRSKYILFLVFFLLSINMIISFFDISINVLGVAFFAFSVSLDSFCAGLTLNYIVEDVILACITFSVISFIMTLIGFFLGKYANKMIGRYSYLIGGTSLLLYSIWVLTK